MTNSSKKTISPYGFVLQIYQPMFILFLILLVFLARESPKLVFPEIVYLLFGFLFCNLLTNHALSKNRASYRLIDMMSVVNCVLVTAIVYYSGGQQSYLWVLYLFPIFSAVAIFGRKEALGVLVLVFLFWFLVYENPRNWNSEKIIDWLGKSSLIFIGAVFINSFIREKKKIEEKLTTQRVKLDNMQSELLRSQQEVGRRSKIETIGHRTSKIIHDLGTPLTIILASARLLTKTETPARQDINRIIDASVMCKNIISTAFDFEDKKAKPESLDIAEVLESALNTVMPMLVSKAVTVKRNYSSDIFVNAVSTQMERVFINIITNAKKAMEHGGVLTVNVTSDSRFAYISIEDTGPGFPAELLKSGPRMFETTRLEGQGIGIGLMSAKEAVGKSGGELILSNKPKGKGAVVTVKIPLAFT